MTLNDTQAAEQPAPAIQLRQLVARSNRLLISRLPRSWIYVLAWPHEIWHYLAARALGLRAFIVPGATVFEPTGRLKTAVVLGAPAALGLVIAALMLGLHWAGPGLAAIHWVRLAQFLLWWWSGCLGDFIDLGLLARRSESEEQRLARSQRLLERYDRQSLGRYARA
jgi:hypothetical protein